MLPYPTVPASLLAVLALVRSVFTAPTYVTSCHLAVGMTTATGRRTVTGMLTAAGLARTWSHDRAHQFFSRAAWDPARLGLVLARAVVTLLLPPGTPVVVIVDDTLFRRRGKKVYQARWAHDGSGRGKDKTGFGNTWVIAAIVVHLPLVTNLAGALGEQGIDVVADAVYHHRDIAALPANVTWTFRLPRNAVLTGPKPPPTHRRGRPRKKGGVLGTPIQVADATTDWETTEVNRYGKTEQVHLAVGPCQWYGAFTDLPVRLVLLRDDDTHTGCDLAVLTTDPDAQAAVLIERYSCRWPIEPIFQHGREDLGIGQAHNRTPRAVERTVPFGLTVYTLIVLWYALYGYHPDDVTERREQAPWYTDKSTPALADMLVKLRRTVIAARILDTCPGQPGPAEIQAVRRAWLAACA
jgi:hypothetical protein